MNLPSPKFEIDKLEAATRQLNVAIEMFFNSGDFIAVHTLAAAAEGILSGLAKHKLGFNFFDFIVEHRRKEFINATHAAQNFFKHADWNPDDLLEFAPTQSHFTLAGALHYALLLQVPQSPEQQAYFAWFINEYPDVFQWDKAPKEFQTIRAAYLGLTEEIDPFDPVNLKPFQMLMEQLRKKQKQGR